MVSVVVNPYQGVDWSKQYKANLHTHTVESDGSVAVADVVAAYNGANYDILAISDHDKNTDWVAPAGLLKIPNREVTLSIPHVSAVLAESGTYTNDLATALSEVKERGGFSFINHIGRIVRTPQWWVDVFDDSLNTYGAEVYNQGDRYAGDRALWDSIHDITLARSGGKRVIWGISNDDMHVTSQRFKNYSYFLMNDLTTEDFKEAFRKGAFYFCYEPDGTGYPDVPIITGIKVDSSAITIAAVGATAISWVSSNAEVGAGASINLSALTGKNYVRAVLTNPAGVTLTQPFVLQEEEAGGRGSMLMGNFMSMMSGKHGLGGDVAPPSLVTRGLIRHYKFDAGSGQVLTDYSGNNAHGQLGSGSGTDSQDPAWVDGGLSFDGSNDQVVIPGESLGGGFTVISVNAPAHLVNNYYMGSTLGNVRQGYSASGMYYMRSVPSGANHSFYNSSLAIGVPRCVTFQRLDDNTVRCIENDGDPVVGAEQPGAANWEYLGQSPSYYFSGKIYYTLIYNVALTLEEIGQCYRYLQAEMAARGVVIGGG